MKKRIILILVGLLSAIVGGTAVYFLIAVPRDLKADRLVREAHDLVKQKKDDEARRKLRQVVKDYPRTEAGASASSALFEIEEQQRMRLEKQLAALQKENAELSRRLATLETEPTPAAAPATLEKPAAAPKPVIRKAPVKKKPAARRTARRTARRRR
jgi:TolA-binding protein